MSVERNCELRREARELLESGGSHSPEFYRVLADECLRRCGEAPAQAGPALPPAMSDDESRAFERACRLPFGKHRGELVAAVPLDYLCWFADNVRDKPVGRQVARYVRSERVLRERNDEHE